LQLFAIIRTDLQLLPAIRRSRFSAANCEFHESPKRPAKFVQIRGDRIEADLQAGLRKGGGEEAAIAGFVFRADSTRLAEQHRTVEILSRMKLPIAIPFAPMDALLVNDIPQGDGRLLRWRPDKAPRQCTFDQIAPPGRGSFALLQMGAAELAKAA
jgi:hypothetical protein